MLLEKDPWNVIITGVGGQGNVLASQILGQLLVEEGFTVTIGETYGASQRGGSVMSHLRISRSDQFSPLIPEGQCDMVVGLEPTEALRVLAPYGNPGVLLLTNTRPIYPIDVIAGDASYPELPVILEALRKLAKKVWTVNATEIALGMGDPVYANIVMLGALSATEVLPVRRGHFAQVIRELMPSHLLEKNLEAFEKGREGIREVA